MKKMDNEVLYSRVKCQACKGSGLQAGQLLWGIPVTRTDGKSECHNCNGRKTVLVPLSEMIGKQIDLLPDGTWRSLCD